MLDILGSEDIPLEFMLMGVALLMMGAMLAVLLLKGRSDVRRRTSVRATDSQEGAAGHTPEQKTLYEAKTFSVDKLIRFVNDSVITANDKGTKVLKTSLIQAGYFQPSAIAVYFIIRITLCIVLALAAYFMLPLYFSIEKQQTLFLLTTVAALVGYLAPGYHLSSRIKKRKSECLMGFPDFMDLMVVCAEAGLSLEAAIERVARELAQGYPALGENLYMMSLEVRAGKRIVDAMLRMSERIGLDEARALATLLQQSCELGSSLSHSLKIYSDDMRHKRMSKAEEKAYALPAKLVVPLIAFVFPVLLVTLLFPAIVRLVYM
jgi:tight adherence protein C